MKKHRSKQSTVQPPEWNGRNFNNWQRSLQRELDKMRNTDVAKRYLVK